MVGHNAARGIMIAIEVGALLMSVVTWRMAGTRIRQPRPGATGRIRALIALAAAATTAAVFIRYLFVDLFLGRSGEAMLATLPRTLLLAPALFAAMFFAASLWARGSRR